MIHEPTGVDLTPYTDGVSQRYDLSKPWRMADGRAVAANGRVLIVLGDHGDIPPPSGRVPSVSSIIADAERLLAERSEELTPVPKVEGPPPNSDPWWNTGWECHLCEGSCECSKCLRECPACDGTGREGGEWWSAEAVELLGGEIDRSYLWLVGQLPGAQILGDDSKLFAQHDDREATNYVIKWDGGIAVVCGLATETKETPITEEPNRCETESPAT